MLTKGISIEVRNDNDKRFSAKLIQDFFKENYLDQVFSHPYTYRKVYTLSHSMQSLEGH